MKVSLVPKSRMISLIFSMILVIAVNAQDIGESGFKYISPVPGSRFIMPQNNIALRHGEVLDRESIATLVFRVEGTKSGSLTGRLTLSDDGRTIIFLPEKPFEFGEEVHVKTSGSVMTVTGIQVENLDFTFIVTERIPELPKEFRSLTDVEFQPYPLRGNQSKYTPVNGQAKDNNLPDDFPHLSVEVMNASSDNGYYFVSPFGYWGWFPENTPYLIIFDDHAVPVFYRRLENHGYDFKLNANGLLSFLYNEWPVPYYQILNASAEQVDTYTMQNGYLTDFHEFFMLGNGHAFIMAYDPQIVDMSQVVPGGVEDAIVIGWVFQELDVNKNVVFQWRSWDHYNILDAEGYVNLTSSTIDLVHGNAIEVTPDDALLLSPRNLNEITKVDRNTGEIIWRLNGNNNMFEFINDTLGFSWQHDCRVLANGNISIFDNGSYHPEPQFSSVVEYEIDEENFTATLVRRLRNDPDIFGTIMGSGREMPDGSLVAGWGSGVPGATEFDAAGNVASVYYFAGINYRTYRSHWSTGYFEADAAELNFGYIWMEDQKTKSVKVTNNQEKEILVTGHHMRGDRFIVENQFPVIIPAGGQASFQITFIPFSEGSYTDVLTLNSDIHTDTLVQRQALQVHLTGHATQGQGTGGQMLSRVTVAPNPVTDNLKLSFDKAQKEVLIAILNSTGQKLKETVHSGTECYIDMRNQPCGLYFVEVRDGNGTLLEVLKIVKE